MVDLIDIEPFDCNRERRLRAMPPAQFYVRLQHGQRTCGARSQASSLYLLKYPTPKGIAGGFAPPTPKAVHMMTRSTDEPDKLTIQSMHKEDGTASLTALAPKHLKTDDHGAMIDELCGILRVYILS